MLLRGLIRLREDPVTVQTLRGTRPGSPWADVVFNTLFARVITRGRPQWHDESCAFVPEIAWNGVRAVQRAAPSPGDSRMPIEEVVFADDLAVLGAAKSAVALPKATATLTASILDSFYSHGLRPNMGPGKTSAVLAPHGALVSSGTKSSLSSSLASPFCWKMCPVRAW